MPWTLEGELKQIAGEQDIVASLTRLGMVTSDETLVDLTITRDWYRSGAETYGLCFAVETGLKGTRNYFMKACVAYSGGVPLAEILDQWLGRRDTLNDLGVQTPMLYAKGSALLVEEYIALTIWQALKKTQNRMEVLASIGWTAAKLVNAGFAPMSTHDWRSRGRDVVIVDFGQDLGPSGMTLTGESGLLSDIIHNMTTNDLVLSPTELQTLSMEYERTLSR